MLHFLAAGLYQTFLFLLPLVVLPLLAAAVYRLHTRRLPRAASLYEQELRRLNFNVLRYAVYLPLVPALILLVSLALAATHGVAAVLNSMIWLSLAIMLSLGWSVFRLVSLVSTRTRLQARQGTGHGA